MGQQVAADGDGRLMLPRLLLPSVLLAGACVAQDIHFGLKAGIPFTAYYETGRESIHGSSTDYSAATRRYAIGASVEWRLGRTLGLEIDTIYRRTGYVSISTALGSGTLTTSSFDVKGHSWDFPMMLKCRLGRGRRPYIAGGISLRYLGPVRAQGKTTVDDSRSGLVTESPIDTSDPTDLRERLRPGAVMAAGIELGSGRLRLLPELRYTRWNPHIADCGGLLRLNPNQAEFLLGLLF